MSLRLIREIHEILLSRGRGSNKEQSERFRRSQNWIGGTRPSNAAFVPPPPELVMECMGQPENFLHTESSDLPLLIRAALAHVQFESIHPFLDGNGRLGRLLITFLLCADGALSEPILYLSLYFKSNRQTYYDLLTSVRTSGDWEAWIEFFLTGVKETSEQAITSARRLIALLDDDRKKIEALGRPAASVLRVFHYAQTHPILSIAPAAEKIESTFPTVAAAIRFTCSASAFCTRSPASSATGCSRIAATWTFSTRGPSRFGRGWQNGPGHGMRRNKNFIVLKCPKFVRVLGPQPRRSKPCSVRVQSAG